MRRTDLTIAALAALGSLLSLAWAVRGDGAPVGLLLGALLLVDAVARYVLATRR